MKKKLFAAAAAAMLAVCALAAPLSVSAETETPKYRMGDVDMDGKVTGSDCLLVMKLHVMRGILDFSDEALMEAGAYLTEEQIALADVDPTPSGYYWTVKIAGHEIDLHDARVILQMSVLAMTHGVEYIAPEDVPQYLQ